MNNIDKKVIYTLDELELIYSDSILLNHAIFDRMLEEEFNEDTRYDIIRQITNLEFDTSVENFNSSLIKATKTKHGAYLSKRNLSSLKKMKTFKVKNIDAGFALCNKNGYPPFSEIVAVHNASNYPNIGTSLMHAAVYFRGRYLECFGEPLAKGLYMGVGFHIYKEFPHMTMKNGNIESLYFMKWRNSYVPEI